jgi:two-component system sensor histidine kinase MtrB
LLALVRALAAGDEPLTDDPGTDTSSGAAPDLALDDLGEAVARLRGELLREGIGSDDPNGPQWARRHAELDAAALEAASEVLRAYAERNRRFLQDVSHDLRSPLNSILFLADALRNEHSGPLNAVQSRQMDVLFMATVTLVKMVNDLIDFARLQDGAPITVGRAAFSLETVVEDVRRLVGPLVSYHRAELRVETAAEGLRTGDPQLLSRVLLNLVSNALQAIPDGGTAELSMRDDADGSLVIEVREDGDGADLERIRRVIHAHDPDAVSGETRGWTHGLGLSISARLVRAAGGRIDVGASPGGGAAFTVLLPFPPL